MGLPDVGTLAAYGAGLGSFLASFGGAAYAVLRKIRKQATTTVKTEMDDTQKKIDKAVNETRKSQGDVIKVLQDACDAYKELAGVRQAQKDDLTVQFTKLQDDFKKIKKENVALRQANTDMTVELKDLKDRLVTLENLARSLPAQPSSV